jgi:hypothetical protein
MLALEPIERVALGRSTLGLNSYIITIDMSASNWSRDRLPPEGNSTGNHDLV